MAFLNGNVKRPSLRHLLMIVRQQIAADGPPGRGGGGVLRGRLGGGEPSATPKRLEKKTNKPGGIVSWGCLDMSRYV